MRPIRLEMQAFCVYAERQEIDFAQLQHNRFFLIHGPTGSGKTTLLDGMAYALYGESSGGERGPGDVRSHLAKPELLTEVSFTFGLGEKYYRITRSPKQEVPKKRGSGFTEQSPKAFLYELDSETPSANASLISDRISDVDAKIVDLLGFRCDQFRQVILLPQGRFRELLTDASKDRQEILRSLFRTQRYEVIQKYLADMSKDLAEKLKTLRIRTEQIIRDSGAGSIEEIEQRQAELLKGLEDLKLESQTKSAERETCRKTLEEEKAVFAKIHRFREAEKDLKTLEEQKPQWDAAKGKLLKAQEAEKVKPYAEQADQAKREADQLSREMKQARKAQALAEEKGAEAARILLQETQKEGEREKAREEKQRLGDLLPKYAELEEAKKALAQAEKNGRSLQSDLEKARSALSNCEVAIKDLENQEGALAQLAAKESGLKAETDQLAALLQQLRMKDEAQARLLTAQKTLKTIEASAATAETQRNKAKDELARSEQRWLKGQSALLSVHLVDGEPCPVCGSKEHPSPAAAQPDLPTETELEQLRQIVAEAESARDEKKKALGKQEAAVAGAQAAFDQLAQLLQEAGSINAAMREKDLNSNLQELAKARKAASELAQLRQKREPASGRKEALAKECASAETTARDAGEALAAAREKVLERSAAMPKGYPDAGALADAIRIVEAKLAAMIQSFARSQQNSQQAERALAEANARKESAEQSSQRAGERAVQAYAEFSKRLGNYGFSSRDDFAQALMEPATMRDMESKIRRFEDKRNTAAATLTAAKAEAENLSEPDIASRESELAAMDQAINEINNQIGDKKSMHDRLKTILRQLGNAAKERADLEKQFATVGKVADIVNGKGDLNQYRISLERFVQGVWLDRVLMEASHLLRKMSGNRFAISRRLEEGSGRRAAGLDLDVIDAYTGKERPVATLSGGEGFMASLALALGLASVVQQQAGGIQLETIFIDEGFGTLDPRALDEAINALLELQQGGRLVGISFIVFILLSE